MWGDSLMASLRATEVGDCLLRGTSWPILTDRGWRGATLPSAEAQHKASCPHKRTRLVSSVR